MDKIDRNSNPLQPAMYRGERVFVDVSITLLSFPPKYNITYGDGRRSYAPCDDVQFIAGNPFASNPSEDDLRAEIARANQEYEDS